MKEIDMKTTKYILILLILSLSTFNSCLVDDKISYDLNDSTTNVVTFEVITTTLACVANGEEYTFALKMKLVGPTAKDIQNDITVTVTPSTKSTAVNNDHYKIVHPSITLTPEDNFLGLLEVTLLSEGNSAPMDDDPAFLTYVAPILVLDISATGDPMVTGSGKSGTFTLGFNPPNPYAGDYISHIIYRHPSYGTYPDNIYTEEDNAKTLSPVTGRKCETWFGVWDTDLCWITVKADNSIVFEVWSAWPYEVKLGDPFDSSKISYYDPATGIIYLYYHYFGTGGPRIFWEVFTPVP